MHYTDHWTASDVNKGSQFDKLIPALEPHRLMVLAHAECRRILGVLAREMSYHEHENCCFT